MVVERQIIAQPEQHSPLRRTARSSSVARPGERQVWTLALTASWMIDHLDGGHVGVGEMMIPRHAQVAVKGVLEDLGRQEGRKAEVFEDLTTREPVGMAIEGVTQDERGIPTLFGTFHHTANGNVGVERIFFRYITSEE